MYLLALQTKAMSAHLLHTAHAQRISDVTFPHAYSEVFASSGFGEIRVWHLQTRRELLRISVPNLDCLCIAFSQVSLLLARVA